MKYYLKPISACIICLSLALLLPAILKAQLGKTWTKEDKVRYDAWSKEEDRKRKEAEAEEARRKYKQKQAAREAATSKPETKKYSNNLTTNYYQETGVFKDGLAVVGLDKRYGYIDETRKLVVPLRYDYAADFSEGYGGVMLDERYGFVDKAGNEVIPLIYEKTGFTFRSGFVSMMLQGKWGLIDTKGATVIPFIYEESFSVFEDLAATKLNGYWGFIDKTGKVIVPFKYDKAFRFSEGVAAVRVGANWGYINNKGVEIIKPIYQDVEYFIDGKVKVKYNGKTLYFDKTGKEIVEKINASSNTGDLGTQAPDFRQNDISGKPISLSSFKGKYVLIHFWAGWSEPCKLENQNVAAVFNRFKNKNFTALGVSLDKDKSKWQEAILNSKLNWPQVSDLQGWNNSVALLYKMQSIPGNYLIDPRGKIVAKNLRGPQLEARLCELLGCK